MPIPIILGVIAGGSALYGVVKGVKGAMDHSEASDLNGSAQSIVNTSVHRVEGQRKTTNDVISDYGDRKLRAFNGVIPDFIEVFGALKDVSLSHSTELDKLNLGDFSSQSLQELKNEHELLMNSGLGLGAGLGGGAALAFGAYNGTMLLATASTGTAISSLSGAAATNATLAWLGGGSLAAGGGGVAMGAMVLGGMVAGPAIAIFGHIMGNKAESALNTARSNLDQARTFSKEADLTISKLEAIEKIATLANNVFSSVSARLRRAVHDLRKIIEAEGTHYPNFSREHQDTVMQSVKFAQLLKAMIDTPLLDTDGKLVLSTEKRLLQIKESVDA